MLIPALFAASIVAPSAASAQALPAAVVAVVDLDKVTSDCTACKTATAALRGQASAIEARAKALAPPLEAEQKAIQAVINALGGKQPDAALEARIKAFQAKQQSGAVEIDRRQDEIRRNQEYIRQQIATKLGPIYQQVMTARGATVLVDSAVTLATSASIDVTADVTRALNASLPSIATTAPAQAQQQPQGR
ncbi:MAG: OmpH family outer membrane protein [Sphingomicrobium sp.]